MIESVGRRIVRTSSESVHHDPAMGDKAGISSTTWDK